VISLIADHHLEGWNADVRDVLRRLASTVLQATQNHVTAVTIARTSGPGSETVDDEAFLEATWQVVQAKIDATPWRVRRAVWSRVRARCALTDAGQ